MDDGKIVDAWPGATRAFCTRQEFFQVKMPISLINDQALKLTLLGTTLLIDIAIYEQPQD